MSLSDGLSWCSAKEGEKGRKERKQVKNDMEKV